MMTTNHAITRAAAIGIGTLVLAASPGLAQQVVTVDLPSRDVDIDIFPFSSATIADLPGPDGRVSFAEALIVSNNTPGRQTIAFAIDPSEFFFQNESPGVAVIFMNPPSFNDVTAPVTIDGTTQTAFSGDTNPDGAEVRIRGASLNITAPDVVVRGLDSSVVSLQLGATGCTIEGNTGLFPLVGTGDGAGAIDVDGNGEVAGHVIRDNQVGVISLDRSSGNQLTGNTTRRIEVLGFVSDFGGTGPAIGNRIGGPTPSDGNIIMGDGSFSSSPFGMPSGWCIRLFDTEGTLIENNLIGTTPNGTASGSDTATIGIWTSGGINRDLTIRANTIAGIRSEGLRGFEGFFFGAPLILEGENISIVGNTIGLDPSGQPTLGSPSASGLTGTDIRFGGAAPGEGNKVAGHTFGALDLIGADLSEVAVEITGNSFHDNNLAGDPMFPAIDLRVSNFGVTPNDPLDADTGPNGLQNFPELTRASIDSSGGTQIAGILPSEPESRYRIEVFASPLCDVSGHGPGEQFLGSFEVSTDQSGAATFDQLVPGAAPAGWLATATATSLDTRATSEFSECTEITGSPTCPADLAGAPDGGPDGTLDANDFFAYLDLFASGDPGADLAGAPDGGPDGTVDANDFFEYLRLFADGCP